MPPNETSWMTLFSMMTSLNQVFVPFAESISTTMPPVRFESSHPVWNVTQGG